MRRNVDFLHLWGAATVSNFGSVVTGATLPFVAILLLHASPTEIAALIVSGQLPGFLLGLVAGAWVDRLRRRPIMIAADLGRALLLASVPLTAVSGSLSLAHLYAVAALVSALSVFFDVAYQSFLPSVVRRDELIDANSRISGAAAVAEAAGFSCAGWLVQILTAPLAVLVDALTFLASAGLIARITTEETARQTESEAPPAIALGAEAVEGLRTVWREPILRGLVGASVFRQMAFGLIGAVILLYANQELGFGPGILGMVFAVGGISSFAGAMLAARLPAIGIGTMMTGALVLAAIGVAFIPLATAADMAGVVLLVAQQIAADAAFTIYDITQVSLCQAVAPPGVLGRVNASFRVTEIGALLAGTVAGGYFGETIGLRATLWLAVAVSLLAAAFLALSPVRDVRRIPAMPVEALA